MARESYGSQRFKKKRKCYCEHCQLGRIKNANKSDNNSKEDLQEYQNGGYYA